jgi:predicted nucleic acid-binding protein
MIVVDASALADVLLRVGSSNAAEHRILDAKETLHAPHLVDLEILQVLRRFASAGKWETKRATEALADFDALRIARHPHKPFRQRIWELRKTVTAYDAAYLALAESLGCPLVTRDAKLRRASGHVATVEVL